MDPNEREHGIQSHLPNMILRGSCLFVHSFSALPSLLLTLYHRFLELLVVLPNVCVISWYHTLHTVCFVPDVLPYHLLLILQDLL
jgi:hypothetical protein